VAGAGLLSVGRAAFLHNVIIVSPSYNATLCKEALGKVFVARHNFVTEGYCCGIQKLLERGRGWAISQCVNVSMSQLDDLVMK
jgi:hypothetical protein